MRRFFVVAVVPLALTGLLAEGCQSSADESNTGWNQGSTWTKESQASAAAPSNAVGTATNAGPAAAMPPTTQPAQ